MNAKTNIGEHIAYYRRLNAMTQEELAKKLNISPQSVSKWDQKISSPDITLLPELAEIFDISIDNLFGIKDKRETVFSLVDSVPWNDDRQIRVALYHGKKLMKQSEYTLHRGLNEINVHFNYGDIYDIRGVCKLNV